ncbi:GNAT family N-acetyltransferase [Maribacter chungangensis]|uniref:GNAT family N-acetyltransferase n=1 Tax=Maribacter chungangensis TaxID=1069117 RepID=A0ABW3B213_9FLAO
MKYQLRKSNENDFQTIVKWFENDEFSFFLWTGFDFEFSETYLELKKKSLNKDISCVSVYNLSEMIGYYEIHRYQKKSNWFRLVRFVINPEFRNKGYGSKIIKSIVDDYQSKPYTRLDLIVFEENINAIKLYLNQGFILEGVMRKAGISNEKYMDISILSILGKYD